MLGGGGVSSVQKGRNTTENGQDNYKNEQQFSEFVQNCKTEKCCEFYVDKAYFDLNSTNLQENTLHKKVINTKNKEDTHHTERLVTYDLECVKGRGMKNIKQRGQNSSSRKTSANAITALKSATLKLLMWLLVFAVGLSLLILLPTQSTNKNNNAVAVGDTPDYIITTADEFLALQTDTSKWSSHIRLDSDLTITSTSWSPIGTNSTTPFTGVFDGNGHLITFTKEIYNTNSSVLYIGVFGYANGATIKNLGVDFAIQLLGNEALYVGGIVGYAENTIINGCYNLGSIVAGNSGGMTNSYGGGIAGYATGLISNCYNAGYVTSILSHYAGGIIGNGSATIINCYNLGNITANGTSNVYAGGIAGKSDGGQITNCFSSGTDQVSYSDPSGGGGDTSTGFCVGGICARGGTVSNCYYACTLTGGVNSGLGKKVADPTNTTALNAFVNAMKNKNTYTNGATVNGVNISWDASASWDFARTWEFRSGENDGYPVLRAPVSAIELAVNVNFGSQDLNGIILYVFTGTAESYTNLQQIYVSKNTSLNLYLIIGETYTFVVAKPYMYNVKYTTSSGAEINESMYNFVVDGASGNNETLTVSISGDQGGGNNFIVV